MSVRLAPINVSTGAPTYQELEEEYQENTIWKFLYGGFSIVLLIAFIISLFFLFKFRTEFIDPSSCPSIKEPYAVRPATFVDPLQTTFCPGGLCKFEVNNLSEAIAQCNLEPNLCQGFVYQNTSPPSMWYVNPEAAGVLNNETDMYIRQV